MMLKELVDLFAVIQENSEYVSYESAILRDNVLRKATQSNRERSLSHLRALYSLDQGNALFRNLRRLWNSDSTCQPLLAFQLSFARDGFLRASAPVILEQRKGATLERFDTETFVRHYSKGTYTEASVVSFSQNINGSWTQAGFLYGKLSKIRTSPVIGYPNIAFALFIAYLDGWRGESMFETQWLRLLDRPREELMRLAEGASRSGIIRLMASGGVVELRFPGWLTPEEEALLNG